MSAPLQRQELERFRAIVARTLGLHFDEGKQELLAGVLQERVDGAGEADAQPYLRRLETALDPGELRALAERLTVGETYFFRNENDLAALRCAVLPELLRARAATRRLRFLSAGCASGEEPYTLAMLVTQVPDLASWDVSIHGIDVNAAALARARAGRYSRWSLRQTPAEARARFFHAAGSEVAVDDALRRMVTFEERNLAAADEGFWRPDRWDVVFCRNVLMYLVPDVARRVVEAIGRSLSPGGYLFLGHAETLRGISSAFALRHTHETFYYQPRDAPAGAPEPPAAELSAPLCEIVDRSGSWVDAIQRASARVAHLARAPGPPPPADRAEAEGPAPAGILARALELVRDERYAEALRLLPADAGGDGATPDLLLLQATLLAITGAPDAAERSCRRILERDELNPEAHYVMALCREHARDRSGAVDHDQYAVYLDAGFAMPRLHLGLMAKRAGEVDAARRDLARASVLLAYEDTSRILLLGGGFTRHALLELCRRELRACGGVA